MVQNPSWEANWLQLVKKFPAFYGTRRFITALTSVCHLSLSWASPIQSTYPHPISWRSILIFSTHLCLGLPSGLFPSGFPTKTLYIPLSSPICVIHIYHYEMCNCEICGFHTSLVGDAVSLEVTKCRCVFPNISAEHSITQPFNTAEHPRRTESTMYI